MEHLYLLQAADFNNKDFLFFFVDIASFWKIKTVITIMVIMHRQIQKTTLILFPWELQIRNACFQNKDGSQESKSLFVQWMEAWLLTLD